MNIVDKSRIHQELLDLYPATLTPIRDARLACPSRHWLVGPFSEFLKDNLRNYTPEKYDCDDFGLKAVVLATECLNETADLSECGHSVGLCFTHIVGERGSLNGVADGYHACNLVRLDDGDWIFYEPQNQRLTDARKSIAAGVAKPTHYIF